MLFDFHRQQNAKKPSSVHATYIVTGAKRATKPPNGATSRDGRGVGMRSSPFMSSMPELQERPDSTDESGRDQPVKTTTIELVPEEKLQGASWFLATRPA
jgi:DNA polymerase delta subunit 3